MELAERGVEVGLDGGEDCMLRFGDFCGDMTFLLLSAPGLALGGHCEMTDGEDV